MTALPQKQLYTYGDIMALDDGVRYELYGGVPVALASPTDRHQRVSRELFGQLWTFLRGKPCEVFSAPFDVRPFDTDDDVPEASDTVLQPDLMVVCERSKVDRHGIHGAPSLVVEILSDSTARNDRLLKYHMYEKAGVPEYWIVDPEQNTIQVHVLDKGKYPSGLVYLSDATIPVTVLEGCVIDCKAVFGV